MSRRFNHPASRPGRSPSLYRGVRARLICLTAYVFRPTRDPGMSLAWALDGILTVFAGLKEDRWRPTRLSRRSFRSSTLSRAPKFEEPSMRGDSSLTEAEVRAFVGPKAYYYLSKWSGAMDEYGRATGFKWPAFLISGIWIPYRKMYRNAFILFGIIVGMSVIEEIAAGAGLITENMVSAFDTGPSRGPGDLDHLRDVRQHVVSEPREAKGRGGSRFGSHGRRLLRSAEAAAEQTSSRRSDYSCFSSARSSLWP